MAKKKELPEQDEFLEALKKTYNYCMENVRMLSIIAGGILLGVLIVFLVLLQIKQNRINESALMTQAVYAYQAGNAEEALASLEDFSGKKGLNGAMAEMYQGNILYELGRYEEALKHFEGARDLSEGRRRTIVKNLALQGIAYTQLAMKEFDRAEEILKGIGEPFKDLSLLELGRLYNAKGDTEKAAQVLDELINDFPESPWIPAAERMK
jgi:predicted negative regulator of RcsB-dependent stress response